MRDPELELFTNNKWEVIKLIAENSTSPTDLAEITKTSISNITQQLKVLEAYEILHKKKSEEKATGKPKTIYSLNKEFAYGIMIREGRAEKKLFNLNGNTGLFINMLFTVPQEDIFYIIKFSIKNDEILKKCKAIGYLKSSKDTVELFLVTDHVEDIRAKFSNMFIDDYSGKTKKIVNWTHNEHEIGIGLQKKDEYFVNMIKNLEPLSDNHEILKKYKKGIK